MTRVRQLLTRPTRALTDGLAAYDDALRRAFPLQTKHRKQLPGSIRELSDLLTVDRSSLPPDYMNRARYFAAYLNWFLPWNLLRQGRLLQGLDLDLADGARVVDLGAGPLTFFQALWLARPDLRQKALQLTAVDRSDPALKTGRDLLARVQADATKTPTVPWQIKTVRSQAGRYRSNQPVDLLVAANLLNEIDLSARTNSRSRGPQIKPEAFLISGWEKLLADNGRVLLIEPGVRTAARQLVVLRNTALERGWRVISPCPHTAECPAPGRRVGQWCHFTMETEGVPAWLEKLVRATRLTKERTSLSYLYLARDAAAATTTAPLLVRTLSEAFDLPEGRRGCYGCSSQGLVLLSAPRGKFLPHSGDTVECPEPTKKMRDPQSRALIIPI